MRLPQYEAQLGLPAPRSAQVPVVAAGRAGADVAQLGHQAAQTFGHIAALERKADQENKLTAAIAEARKRLDDTFFALAEDRDYETKAQRYQDAAAKIYGDLRAPLDPDTSRRFYDRYLLHSQTVGHSVSTMVRKERIDFGRAETERNNDRLLDAGIRSRTPQEEAAALAQVQDNIERATRSGFYSEAEGLRQKDKTLGKYEKLKALEHIRKNPALAIRMLDDPQRTRYMDPLDRQALKIQAQNRLDTMAARVSREAGEAAGVLDAAIRNPEAVKPNIPELRKKAELGTPAQRQAFEDRAAIFEEVEALASMPLPKLAEDFEKQREAGVGGKDELRRLSALQLAIARKTRALGADSYTAVVKADPELEAGVAAAGDADAVRLARQRIIDAQLREGVPADRVRLLSRPQAASLERDIQQLQGAERARKIQEVAAFYGDHWEVVERHLQEGKRLPPDVAVIASLPRRSEAERVEAERAGALIGQAFANTPEKWGDLIGKDKARDIAAKVANELAPFAATMAFSPGGPAMAARQIEAAQRLAWLFKFQGESDDGAVEKAKKFLVDDHYLVPAGEWLTAAPRRTARLRIPRRLDGLPVSETAVSALVEYAFENIGKLDIDVPWPGGAAPKDPAIAAEARSRYLRHIADKGFAYAAEDGEGFVIMSAPGEPVTIGRGAGLVRVDFRGPASIAYRAHLEKALGAHYGDAVMRAARLFQSTKRYPSDELPEPFGVVPIVRQRFYAPAPAKEGGGGGEDESGGGEGPAAGGDLWQERATRDGIEWEIPNAGKMTRAEIRRAVAAKIESLKEEFSRRGVHDVEWEFRQMEHPFFGKDPPWIVGTPRRKR